MGKFTNTITPAHEEFIEQQHMFFVATAPLSGSGKINLSPKGLDAFRVLDKNKVAYADFIGSGNEISAHTLENGRITFMFCSFTKVANILRLYGKGFAILRNTKEWDSYASNFTIFPSTRQIIVADIDFVQTSCGFGVPLYDYKGERDTHFVWADKLGTSELSEYVQNKNVISLDGMPTNIGLK